MFMCIVSISIMVNVTKYWWSCPISDFLGYQFKERQIHSMKSTTSLFLQEIAMKDRESWKSSNGKN